MVDFFLPLQQASHFEMWYHVLPACDRAWNGPMIRDASGGRWWMVGVMSAMNRYWYSLSKDWIPRNPKIHSRLVDMKLHSWGLKHITSYYCTYEKLSPLWPTAVLSSGQFQKTPPVPIGSMYAIYGNIYHQYTPNVSIYAIHGSYGVWVKVCQIYQWTIEYIDLDLVHRWTSEIIKHCSALQLKYSIRVCPETSWNV